MININGKTYTNQEIRALMTGAGKYSHLDVDAVSNRYKENKLTDPDEIALVILDKELVKFARSHLSVTDMHCLCFPFVLDSIIESFIEEWLQDKEVAQRLENYNL